MRCYSIRNILVKFQDKILSEENIISDLIIEDVIAEIKSIINKKLKIHKKDGSDCADCGLFRVIKGEVCDCEYNDAIKDVLNELG